MWVYCPNASSPSVPGPADSTLAYTWPWADVLAQSATWNTRSQPPQSWRRAWKMAPWMQHLFGQTSTPSTVARGAEEWRESLVVSPASPSPSPESSGVRPIPGTSGLASQRSFEMFNPNGASSRTCEGMCGSDCEQCEVTFSAWVTQFMQAYSRRRKSARHTSGNGSSSWLTPDTEMDAGPNGQAGLNQQVAKNWPTAMGLGAGSKPENNLPDNSPLHRAAKNWPTVTEDDASNLKRTSGGFNSLTRTASQWPSPHGNASTGAGAQGRDGGLNLQTATAHWQTPASDSFRSRGGDRKAEMGLDQQARAMWQTPSANEDAAGTLDGKMQFMLTHQARSHLAPETLQDGSESLPSGQTSPRRLLNPRFAAWLMGWDPAWTSLAPLSSASSGTESCPNRPPTPFGD